MADKIAGETDSISEKSIADLAQTLSRCRGNYSFLIGAGTSRAAGIETSGELIEQWSSKEYKEKSPEKPKIEWIEEVEENIPEHQNKYGFWFEERYTTREERRQFIKDLVEDADPTFEHIVLSSLMQEGYVPITLTPNFDDLLYDAFYLYHEKRPFLVDHNAIAPQFKITHDDPMIVKLHGDYLYDNLKNTGSETSELASNIEEVLETTLNEYGLIVLGYAGEDESIMGILQSERIKIPDYGLFWCTRDKENLSEDVEDLLKQNNTFLIEIESSEGFFVNLYEQMEDLNVPTPVDVRSRAGDRAGQLREGIVQVGGADIIVLASEYMRRDENDNAIELLNEAIEKEGKTVSILTQRSRAFRQKGDYDRSIGDLSDALDRIGEYEDPADRSPTSKWRLKNSRARIRSRAGYTEKAIEDFNDLTEERPNNSTTYANLSEAYILNDNYENAINAANNALEYSDEPSEKAHSLMLLSISKMLDGREYEGTLEKFEDICSEGLYKNWNFKQIEELIEGDGIDDAKKQVVRDIKDMYEQAPEVGREAKLADFKG